MAPRQSVLVLGSTGTIGVHITKALASASGNFRRLAILTSAKTASTKTELLAELRFQGVEVIVGDLANDAFLKETFQDFEIIVSALGRNALHLQPHVVDIVAALPKLPNGHVRRFYPSEYGTDIRYDDKTSPHEKPHQNKLKTRAHIEELAKQGKIEFTYIVTGPFIDTFIFSRAGGRACYDRDAGSFGIVGPQDASRQSIISGTTYSDTGKYVLSSILTPEKSRNATLRVSSVNAKPDEMLQAVQKIESSNRKVQPRYTDLDQFRELEREAWEKTPDAATVLTLTRIWFEGGSDFTRKPNALYYDESGKEHENAELSRDLFQDVPQRPLDEVLREIVQPSSKEHLTAHL